MDKDDDKESLDVQRKGLKEDVLHSKINKAYFSLEIRITVDHLLSLTGARLVNRQGRSIDIHPETAKKYVELQSLIYDYTKEFGTDPGIKEIKDKWVATTGSEYCQ